MTTEILNNNNNLFFFKNNNKVIGIKNKSYIQKSQDIIDYTYTSRDLYTVENLYNAQNLYSAKNLSNLDLDNELSKLDKFIGHLKKNKRKYKLVVTLVALLLPFFPVFPGSVVEAYVVASETSSFLEKVYAMGIEAGKVICAIGAIVETSRCVLTGSVDNLGRVGVKYLAFGLLIKNLEAIITWVFS